MVLLVQHDPEPVLDQQGGPRFDQSRRIEARQFLAHQVPLMQQLPLDRIQLVHPEPGGVAHAGGLPAGLLHLLQYLLPLPGRIPGTEAMAAEVPRQPHPGGKHQVTVGTGGVQPPHAPIGQQAEIDHSAFPRS